MSFKEVQKLPKIVLKIVWVHMHVSGSSKHYGILKSPGPETIFLKITNHLFERLLFS